MNDIFVHAAGDHILNNTAEILLESVRIEDKVIYLTGTNVFAPFWTDRQNMAYPAVKTDNRRLTSPAYL